MKNGPAMRVLFVAAAVLAMALGADNAAAQSASVSVEKLNAPNPVRAGADLTYTITISSEGPDDAANVILTDPLPAGTTFRSLLTPAGWTCPTVPAVGSGGSVSCTIASMAPGSVVFSLVVNVTPSTPDGTVISNTATIASTTPDPDANDNIATVSTLVVTEADMSVAKVDTPDPVLAGADLTYTITVSNAGPSDAASVSLSDPLAAGTTFRSLLIPAGWTCPIVPAVGSGGSVSCTIASMAAGSAVFSLVVNVPLGTPGGTVTANTAIVASATTDPVPAGNSATASTTVLATASLSAAKTVSGTFKANGLVTYTIVISNAGPSTQGDNPGDEFNDVLPATLTLTSATASAGTATATPATNTVTWNGSIPAGAAVTLTINATISATATNGQTISNQGQLAYDANGDGINEATRLTDDPAVAGPADPTTLTIFEPTPVPLLDNRGLLLLSLLAVLLGVFLVPGAVARL